jgi:alpha-amylase
MRLPMTALRRLLVCAASVAVMACGGGGGGGGSAPPSPGQQPLPQNYVPTGRTAAGDTFVHLFEWRWADIARECEVFLGPRGYKAVQISPPSEHAMIAGNNYPWWQRYQTVSYRLDSSRSGTVAQFTDMLNRCRAVGVEIYADAVINHMTAGAGTGSTGSNYTKYSYPAVPWSGSDFHSSCGVNNYQDAANVQNCELVGLADLRTEETSVRNRIADYLIALNALGVGGFRIDAAKHMHPRDIDAIVSRVNDAAVAAQRARPYFFLEVINNPGEAVTAQQYFGVGFASGGASDVTDFLYGYRVTDAFTGRNGATLNSALGSFASVLLPSDKSVVFVDNHDNQRGENLYYANSSYELATIFMLAHPQGYPSVMSSYGFDRGSPAGRDAGPPSAAGGVTTSTFNGNGDSICTATLGSAQVGAWVCEHRRTAIANMVAFRKAAGATPMSTCGRPDWMINADPNRIAFCRDGAGFVAISRSAVATAENLLTRLPPGSYCNVAQFVYTPAAGGSAAVCSGAPIVVGPAPTGNATFTLPANSAVALHINARL